MPLPFEGVRERLLRAGIAPRHATRYVTELREHLADQTERQRASGLDAAQAAERARALIGSDTELAQAMIAKAPPLALSVRAPWLVFTAIPLLLWAALIWAIDSSMLRLFAGRSLTAAAMPPRYQGIIDVAAFTANYLIVGLLLAGCIAVALRQRLTSRWLWVGAGLTALLSGLIGFHQHTMTFSAAGFIYVDGRISPAATFAVAGLRAAVIFGIAVLAYRKLQDRSKPNQALTWRS